MESEERTSCTAILQGENQQAGQPEDSKSETQDETPAGYQETLSLKLETQCTDTESKEMGYLIREYVEDVEYLTENTDNGGKDFYIKGIFLVSEQKNRNGRVYPKHILEREVARYKKDYINENRAFGELDHPTSCVVSLKNASHMITELNQDGNVWVGKAKILNTPMGNIARGIIESGGKLGVSSRGIGNLRMSEGINYVDDNFKLMTAADIVSDPSAPGAFVNGIMENKEWTFIDGVWVEQDIDNSKKLVESAHSREQIEIVSLHIWNNILKKISG